MSQDVIFTNNPWLATSANCTCKFDITYGLMSRNGKSEHPQAAYAARVFKAWRHKAVQWKHKLKPYKLEVRASFLDDKTSFKIADPAETGDEPVAPLERNKKTPVAGGRAMQAGHHSFTWAKGNPSMALLTDIPDDPDGSFYPGQVCGIIQDQVWRPSSAIRHATQFKAMLDAHGGTDNLSLNFIYTDAGPDHHIKHLTVMVALLCLHLSTGADATIAARPAPHNSWVSCIEKIMCIYNYGMYGCVLVREMMDDMGGCKEGCWWLDESNQSSCCYPRK